MGYLYIFPGQRLRDSVIVFIHGVLGDGKNTWTNDENHQYWPSMLERDPDFKEFDIYVHHYPTTFRRANFSIDELAENARLIFDIDGVSAHKDIIFLVHSMGGLLVRAYLLKYRNVAERTRLIYFFSTPSTGAEIASLASLFFSNPQLFAMRPMDQNSEGYLSDLLRAWLSADFGIPSFCAYEKQATYGTKIVTLASASNLCTKRLDPIQANHLTIVKPNGTSDIPYLAFKSAVQSVPRKVSSPAVLGRSKTINTVSQVQNKLALVLSRNEMFLFPAIDDYLRKRSENNWRHVQNEAVELLKLVRQAGEAVLQFDASLRPELGPAMSMLAQRDGIRNILRLGAASAAKNLATRGILLESIAIVELKKPSLHQAKKFKEHLVLIVQQLSDDLSAPSQKLQEAY
jgi:pimeloyl-ACP methyl ester carboxylesterase